MILDASIFSTNHTNTKKLNPLKKIYYKTIQFFILEPITKYLKGCLNVLYLHFCTCLVATDWCSLHLKIKILKILKWNCLFDSYWYVCSLDGSYSFKWHLKLLYSHGMSLIKKESVEKYRSVHFVLLIWMWGSAVQEEKQISFHPIQELHFHASRFSLSSLTNKTPRLFKPLHLWQQLRSFSWEQLARTWRW